MLTSSLPLLKLLLLFLVSVLGVVVVVDGAQETIDKDFKQCKRYYGLWNIKWNEAGHLNDGCYNYCYDRTLRSISGSYSSSASAAQDKNEYDSIGAIKEWNEGNTMKILRDFMLDTCIHQCLFADNIWMVLENNDSHINPESISNNDVEHLAKLKDIASIFFSSPLSSTSNRINDKGNSNNKFILAINAIHSMNKNGVMMLHMDSMHIISSISRVLHAKHQSQNPIPLIALSTTMFQQNHLNDTENDCKIASWIKKNIDNDKLLKEKVSLALVENGKIIRFMPDILKSVQLWPLLEEDPQVKAETETLCQLASKKYKSDPKNKAFLVEYFKECRGTHSRFFKQIYDSPPPYLDSLAHMVHGVKLIPDNELPTKHFHKAWDIGILPRLNDIEELLIQVSWVPVYSSIYNGLGYGKRSEALAVSFLYFNRTRVDGKLSIVKTNSLISTKATKAQTTDHTSNASEGGIHINSEVFLALIPCGKSKENVLSCLYFIIENLDGLSDASAFKGFVFGLGFQNKEEYKVFSNDWNLDGSYTTIGEFPTREFSEL